MRVCLIGLDTQTGDTIALNLRLRWPDLETYTANGVELVYQLRSAAPDLVVLNAWAVDGAQAVSDIRESSDSAIIVLAPEPNEAELVKMLEAGADDYLALSVSAPLLVVRVSAALRRTQRLKEHREPSLECGELRVNPDTHEVWAKGQLIYLTPTEFKLLCYLAKNSGRLVTYEVLRTAIWGSEGDFYADSLRKYVQRLRQKIVDCGSPRVRIETIPRTGYRLVDVSPGNS